MEEVIDEIGIEEVEDGYPVFYTRDKRLFSEAYRIMFINDLLKVKDIKKDVILGRWEAQFYYFFENHCHLAFTVNAFMDKFFDGDNLGLDIDEVEELLNKMVVKRLIKGIYARGYYYYYL